MDTGSEGMTLLLKESSFGHQTTIHWVLKTGAAVNQMTGTEMRTVYHCVGTNSGTTIIVISLCHTSVNPLHCKLCFKTSMAIS